ncbi:hypothetical protein LR48_Vigan11g147800 [Vigna angularis]|uniref:TOG domain-containing protein n=1 Tax=Phaseolus angularis TaxID=3914 RepID=A0A0L9VUL7_PHAAN|nr:hypothetical protein LR48_Vigan11g147800 [Vigna angularis]
MSDSSMYPFHTKLPGAAPCLCPLHHASCTGVTPRPRLRARVSHFTFSAMDIRIKFNDNLLDLALIPSGLISASNRDSIIEGLEEIERRIKNGEFNWRADREDVHMNIGEPAKKLHTARSRNDELIVPPVLNSFADQDSRVRYYACEALYNIAKVVRGDFIIFFNQIFDALCKLSADSDANVQSDAHLLDRLVKINEFVKLGGDQLVPYYADILGAILPCISDKEEKIRVVARETNEKLRAIKADPADAFDVGAICPLL